MNTEITVALIGLLGILIGSVCTLIGKSRKDAAKEAAREQAQNDKFERIFSEMEMIKKKLDQHNHYAEKFGEIEKAIITIQKDIEYIKKG